MFIAYHEYVCLHPLLFPLEDSRMRPLNSACETDQADFTDWMPCLPSNLMEGNQP